MPNSNSGFLFCLVFLNENWKDDLFQTKKKKGGGEKCKISSISIGSPELAVSSRKLFKSCCDLPTPACSSLLLGYVQSWSYRTPSLSSNCQESCADLLIRKETGQRKAPNTDNQKKSRKKEVRENKFPTFYSYLILSLKLFFKSHPALWILLKTCQWASPIQSRFPPLWLNTVWDKALFIPLDEVYEYNYIQNNSLLIFIKNGVDGL